MCYFTELRFHFFQMHVLIIFNFLQQIEQDVIYWNNLYRKDIAKIEMNTMNIESNIEKATLHLDLTERAVRTLHQLCNLILLSHNFLGRIRTLFFLSMQDYHNLDHRIKMFYWMYYMHFTTHFFLKIIFFSENNKI